jgi:hypothetical protein
LTQWHCDEQILHAQHLRVRVAWQLRAQIESVHLTMYLNLLHLTCLPQAPQTILLQPPYTRSHL